MLLSCSTITRECQMTATVLFRTFHAIQVLRVCTTLSGRSLAAARRSRIISLKNVTRPLQNRYETVKIYFACGGLGQRPNLKLLPGARPPT
jgi:hypothetical protein